MISDDCLTRVPREKVCGPVSFRFGVLYNRSLGQLHPWSRIDSRLYVVGLGFICIEVSVQLERSFDETGFMCIPFSCHRSMSR